jgi:hypothetical protein
MTTSIEYIPQIQSHLDAIAKAEGDALGFALRCGLALAGAKAALKIELPKVAGSESTFGKFWEGRLMANFGIAVSTADVYIRLYENKDLPKVAGAKTITEARNALPKERAAKKEDEDEDTGAEDDGKGEDEDEDEDESDNAGDAGASDPGALSDSDREQITSEYIRGHSIPDLYNQLVGLFNDEELGQLYQLLAQRFGKLVRPASSLATAVGSQPAAASATRAAPLPPNELPPRI